MIRVLSLYENKRDTFKIAARFGYFKQLNKFVYEKMNLKGTHTVIAALDVEIKYNILVISQIFNTEGAPAVCGLWELFYYLPNHEPYEYDSRL